MMSKTVAPFKELWPSIPLEIVDSEDKENPQQGICKKISKRQPEASTIESFVNLFKTNSQAKREGI